jgi:uncharacterized protein
VPERFIVADTGPLVAFLVEREPRHQWAVEQFKSMPAPFLTCESVLTEACHLLGRIPHGPQRLFDLLEHGLLVIDFELANEARALQRLMHKYHDVPMSLADACLVRMAELHPTAVVLTLDRHFTIYRKHDRQSIKVLSPDI